MSPEPTKPRPKGLLQPAPEPGPLPGSLAARPRDRGEHPRCVLCHSDVWVAALECPDCGTITHTDCAKGLTTCPTLGCQRPAAELEPVRGRVAVQRRSPLLVALVLGLCAVLLGAGILQLQHYLLSESRRDEAWAARHADDPLELAAGLTDPRHEVQARALLALQDLGTAARPAAPALARSIEADPGVLFGMPRLLAELDPDRAGALFAKLLRRPEGERRFFQVFRACATLAGPPELTAALAAQRDLHRGRPFDYAYAHATLDPELAVGVLLEAFEAAPTAAYQRETTYELKRVAEAGGARAVALARDALDRIAGQAADPSVREAARQRLVELEGA